MFHCKNYFLLAALLLIPVLTRAQSTTDAETLFDKAEEIFRDGDYEQSKEMFEEASETFCTAPIQAETCIEVKTYLSDIDRIDRNFVSSEQILEEAEQILQRELGTPHPLQMEINTQKIFLYVNMTQFEEAGRVVQRTMELVNEPEFSGLPRARGYMAKGYLEDAAGDFHESLNSYSEAVESLEGIERDDEILRFLSHCYNNMGLLTRRLGDVQGAMDYFLQALDVTQTLYGESHPQVGIVHNSIGTIYYIMGDYGQAADYFLSTADIFRENYGENHERVAGAYNNAGVVFTEMDDIERAAQTLEKAQRIKENILGENHIDTAIGYSNLASIYMENENFDAALENYQKSIAVREEIYGDDHPNLISPYTNLGEFYTKTEQFNLAREYLDEALQITKNRLGENHPEAWTIRLNIGDTFMGEEEFETALGHYEKAFNMIVEESGIQPQNGFDAGRVSHPIQFMESATNIGNVLLKLYEEEGGIERLYQSIENYSISTTVVDFLQRSYQSEASKLNLVDQNYSIFTNSIRAYNYLYEETGDEQWLSEILTTSELSRSRIALELLQDLEAKNFAGVPREILDQESTINTQIADYYQKLHAEQEKGFEASQDRISSFRDSLFESRRELKNLTQRLEEQYPDYYRLKYDQSYANREVVVDLLEQDEALINYIVSDEEIFALVLDKSDIRFYSLGKSDSLSTRVKSLRNSVLSDRSEQYSKVANELYNQLIEPILSEININSLIIVPDQSLHYLPFEMLLIEASENSSYYELPYLIRDYKISYVPSATVLQMLKEQKIQNPQNLFAVAPFNESTIKFEEEASASRYMAGLSPLPLTQYETGEIAKIFEERDSLLEYIFPEEVKILLGEEATKSTIETTSFEQYGYIHFATHAFVNEQDPSLSGIVFWGEQDDDGMIYVNDIYNMRMNADLVVLGACETGLGTVYKGEGMIGFTRAFIYAGASNLMVSMWKVNDQPTANLMIKFYRYVKEGHSYSEALQMAKIDLIDQPEFAAPRNWAAFILQGR
ncbi:MAG: CHAT domain-containing tetratricopeptide repeat protein [Balneolaceae bacterium]|nr:CHAT domain-containing tetratricopeptide repeat protein [Balneolaceae bacterium]MDR9408238.1 CHAT domain-containing tetratricopeptide repeat protein [Balneolaceae bacterium]